MSHHTLMSNLLISPTQIKEKSFEELTFWNLIQA